MAGEPVITVYGNLTEDPVLRYTGSGDAVANLSIAMTPRSFDRQTNQWTDDDTIFMRGSVWRDQAANVAETLTKGMRVIATGRMKARDFQDKQGNNRTSWEMDIEEVGPSLRFATAIVNRVQGGGGGAAQGGGFGQQPQQGGGFDQSGFGAQGGAPVYAQQPGQQPPAGQPGQWGQAPGGAWGGQPNGYPQPGQQPPAGQPGPQQGQQPGQAPAGGQGQLGGNGDGPPPF